MTIDRPDTGKLARTTFAIELTTTEHESIVTIAGEIDTAVVSELEAMAQLGLDREDTHTLVIDFGAVTFIDSSGIGALVAIRQAAQLRGKQVGLRNVPEPIARIFDIVALARLFDPD